MKVGVAFACLQARYLGDAGRHNFRLSDHIPRRNIERRQRIVADTEIDAFRSQCGNHGGKWPAMAIDGTVKQEFDTVAMGDHDDFRIRFGSQLVADIGNRA